MNKILDKFYDLINDTEDLLDKEIYIVLWLSIERFFRVIPMASVSTYASVIEMELKVKHESNEENH